MNATEWIYRIERANSTDYLRLNSSLPCYSTDALRRIDMPVNYLDPSFEPVANATAIISVIFDRVTSFVA